MNCITKRKSNIVYFSRFYVWNMMQKDLSYKQSDNPWKAGDLLYETLFQWQGHSPEQTGVAPAQLAHPLFECVIPSSPQTGSYNPPQPHLRFLWNRRRLELDKAASENKLKFRLGGTNMEFYLQNVLRFLSPGQERRKRDKGLRWPLRNDTKTCLLWSSTFKRRATVSAV